MLYALAVSTLLTLAPHASAYRNAVGYNDLLAEFPGMVPDGAGVPVAQVEAEDGNDNYRPDETRTDFDGITFTYGTTASSGISTHATGMARNFYGDSESLAGGVTDVTLYETNDYLTKALRMSPSNAGAPLSPSYRVVNHSWVGSYDSSSDNLEVLRRLDYLINTHEVLSAVGTANGTGTSHPVLFSHTYNALTVGRVDGVHNQGNTTLGTYGFGRSKPDIVVTEGSVSRATAATSSALAMLYQSATDTAIFPDGNQQAGLTEPMRAIVLAGATKDEAFGGGGSGYTWDNSPPSQPLDLVYGAGELNVYNSYKIQQGGQFDGTELAGGPTADPYGWDYNETVDNGSLYYQLEVPQFYTGHGLSVALAWNVDVTFNGSNASHSLANLDLYLYDEDGVILDDPLLTSVSTIDNVEHIWLPDLAEGEYTIEVRTVGASRDFGLAWRLDLEAPYRATGDYNNDGVVDAGDYAVWRRTLGSETELAADGDLNGIVDLGDYSLWRSAFGTHIDPQVVLAAAFSTPEPSTMLLAGVLLALLPRRRR